MKPLTSFAAFAIVASLCACGKQPEPGNPLEGHRKALDKAKGVDQAVQDAAEQMRKKIEAAEK